MDPDQQLRNVSFIVYEYCQRQESDTDFEQLFCVLQLRDFLLVYNRMTEVCFQRCSSNFNYRNLTMDEVRMKSQLCILPLVFGCWLHINTSYFFMFEMYAIVIQRPFLASSVCFSVYAVMF